MGCKKVLSYQVVFGANSKREIESEYKSTSYVDT
jgi:hypothetical protein